MMSRDSLPRRDPGSTDGIGSAEGQGTWGCRSSSVSSTVGADGSKVADPTADFPKVAAGHAAGRPALTPPRMMR